MEHIHEKIYDIVEQTLIIFLITFSFAFFCINIFLHSFADIHS